MSHSQIIEFLQQVANFQNKKTTRVTQWINLELRFKMHIDFCIQGGCCQKLFSIYQDGGRDTELRKGLFPRRFFFAFAQRPFTLVGANPQRHRFFFRGFCPPVPTLSTQTCSAPVSEGFDTWPGIPCDIGNKTRTHKHIHSCFAWPREKKFFLSRPGHPFWTSNRIYSIFYGMKLFPLLFRPANC